MTAPLRHNSHVHAVGPASANIRVPGGKTRYVEVVIDGRTYRMHYSVANTFAKHMARAAEAAGSIEKPTKGRP